MSSTVKIKDNSYSGMTTTIEIPVVTEGDLFDFHTRVFGFSCQRELDETVSSSQYLELGRQDVDLEYADEDDLGYYEDGVKRTLTDEQISIFRHSEIHKLLQKESPQETSASESQGIPNSKDVDSNLDALNGIPHDFEDRPVHADDDDDDEYALFLENEKKEFEATTAQKRMRSRDESSANDRTISTRRRVRELDAPASKNDTLDYGD